MRPRLLPILLILVSALRSTAQLADQNGFTQYTRMNGLSNNSVTGIVQDSLGYIWIATNNGLNRFDGAFFTCYFQSSPDVPLPDNVISTIKLQGRQVLGATGGGGFVLDPAAHWFKRLQVPCDHIISNWANAVWDMVTDRAGHYILSTKTGLYVFDTAGEIVRRYDYHHVEDVGRKELWFGGGLYPLGNGRVMQKSDSALCLYDPAVNAIDTAYGLRVPDFKKAVTDADGTMRPCFPGKDGEVFIFDAARKALDLFDFRQKRSYSMALLFPEAGEVGSSLFFLNDSVLAMPGKDGGFYLVRYNVATHTLSLQGKKFLADKLCTAVFLDRENRLWVGTADGLYKQNVGSPFFEVDDLAGQDPGLKNYSIRTIYPDRDKLFVGLRGKGGVLVLDKSTKKILRHLFLGGPGDSSNNISLFFPYDRDTLWVGTQNGVFWLDRKTYRTGRVVVGPDVGWIDHNNCLAMMACRDGTIWMSFSKLNSLVWYDRVARRFTEIPAEENPLLRITFVFSMAEDTAGNVWLAGDGLCRWNRAKRIVDTLIPYTVRLRNYMYILDRDERNQLWLHSGDNGIFCYNCTTNRMQVCRYDDELASGVESPVIHGHIWLGAHDGILAFDTRDYSSAVFSYADGLPTLATTTYRKGSCYDPEADRVYYGAQDQLISFKPDVTNTGQCAPVLLIDRITTSRGDVSGDVRSIELPYTSNFAQLGFNAVNFLNPEDNRFSYRVMPSADSSWHLLSWQRSINFNDLASGKYTLQLKLASANNRWPEQVREVQLTILPPFWAKGWFIVVVVLAIGGIILGVYRYRVRQVREKLNLDKKVAEFEMKALHAQMNPHFMFNSLNSIREMILHEDNRNASRYLSRFARLIRLNLEHSRQTFITLRQNIDYLESYLEMEQLRFPDFSFKIETARELDLNEIRLAPMLIQPLVENAIWHGLMPKERDKWVHIRFFSRDDKLVCAIEDNGIGIRQSMHNKTFSHQMHRSMGIGNIRERIAVLNEKYRIRCSLTIEDKADLPESAGSGTLITLVFPVHEEELVS